MAEYEIPRVKIRHFGYSMDTPPEDEYSDYKSAYAAHAAAHSAITKIAQGEKYFDSSMGPMDLWSSRSDLSMAIAAYGLAAKSLYDQNEASRQYAKENLGILITQARQDMNQELSGR